MTSRWKWAREFSREELEMFLRAVDRHVSHDQKLVVVGGGAIALLHDPDYETKDIDTFPTSSIVTREFPAACDEARVETGLPVRVLLDLEHMDVRVMEAHDVALSKMLRGSDKDLDAIRGLHKQAPLDEDVLVGRFLAEVQPYAIGNPRDVMWKFLALIKDLFGEAAMDRAKLRIQRG